MMTTVQSLPIWYSELNAFDHHKRLHALGMIYLHGEIEQYASFDLLMASSNDVSIGVYPVIININDTKHACTAHVWNDSSGKRKGLVVLDTDKEARDYAHLKFLNKANRI